MYQLTLYQLGRQQYREFSLEIPISPNHKHNYVIDTGQVENKLWVNSIGYISRMLCRFSVSLHE